LLTHIHPDHAGAAGSLVQKSPVGLYCRGLVRLPVRVLTLPCLGGGQPGLRRLLQAPLRVPNLRRLSQASAWRRGRASGVIGDVSAFLWSPGEDPGCRAQSGFRGLRARGRRQPGRRV